MGELKTKMREGVNENQDRFNEVKETSEANVEELKQNKEIISQLEGVDDDDRDSIEQGKETAHEIGIDLAEQTQEAPKNEINEQMDSVVSETNEYNEREQNEANTASGMEGNYGGVGASLENQFNASADEFREIADSGEQIKEESNEVIDEYTQTMEEEW